MAVVRISTDLPLAAERACALARKPELFLFVVRPVFRATGLPPDDFEATAGSELSARLWWLGVLPAWRHHLRVVAIEPRELRTQERGGVVRRWDHRLSFEPTGERSCRYTDEVTLDAGPATPLVRLFAEALFRWRQARWRALARVIA